VISPQTITIGSLLAHVRRGDIVRVHSLRRGAAEAIEVVVHGAADRSRVIGRRIEDIDLPEGASIVAIARGEQVIMAHHDTLIETEDHLIVFLSDRRHIEAVERLFQARAEGQKADALADQRHSSARLGAGAVRPAVPAADRRGAVLPRGRDQRLPHQRAAQPRRGPADPRRDAALPRRAQAARRLPAGDFDLGGAHGHGDRAAAAAGAGTVLHPGLL